MQFQFRVGSIPLAFAKSGEEDKPGKELAWNPM
jgi:hypothetical protein